MTGQHASRFISDEDIQKALDWLRDNARAIAVAKAEERKAGRMIKVLEAAAYKASDAKTIDAKKAEARTSQRYQEAIDAEFEATLKHEELAGLRDAAKDKIEAWRTMSSNWKAMKI